MTSKRFFHTTTEKETAVEYNNPICMSDPFLFCSEERCNFFCWFTFQYGNERKLVPHVSRKRFTRSNNKKLEVSMSFFLDFISKILKVPLAAGVFSVDEFISLKSIIFFPSHCFLIFLSTPFTRYTSILCLDSTVLLLSFSHQSFK